MKVVGAWCEAPIKTTWGIHDLEHTIALMVCASPEDIEHTLEEAKLNLQVYLKQRQLAQRGEKE
jgi:hypothetical protein